ncbi:type II toxin-antitoxin system CcdA family antitoxin [Saccharomonospora piscinae]|uniref:type II toxin-antitoxin system CcdA family antitoxin n=1 Tax=Saccharomonospora piscinae TaxID=687388 RepID=UPI0004660B54|nr:type II toxin-antitoxin system CcdA family antitoxin [Saccharomonospora piscinae]
MAWLNVHVPDELAECAKREELNVSALVQAALHAELGRRATDHWLAKLPRPSGAVSHEDVEAALDEVRDELARAAAGDGGA